MVVWLVLAVVVAGLMGWLRLGGLMGSRLSASQGEVAPIAPALAGGEPTAMLHEGGAARLTAGDLHAPLNRLTEFLGLLKADRATLQPHCREALDRAGEAEVELRRIVMGEATGLEGAECDLVPDRVAGRGRLDPQVLIARVCDGLSREAQDQGVTLHRPPLAPGLAILADEAELERALTGLIRWTMRSVRPGGAVVIDIVSHSPEAAIVIQGARTASIPPPVIRDPDTQDEARGAIEAMEGRLILDADRPEGARAVIILPSPPLPERKPSPSRKTVVAVHLGEDPASRLLVRRLSAGAGARCHGADTLAEALALVRQVGADVLVVDDDGAMDLAQQAVAGLMSDPLTRSVAVMMVADALRPIDARRARRLGVCASLSRPLSVAAFARALDECLSVRFESDG